MNCETTERWVALCRGDAVAADCGTRVEIEGTEPLAVFRLGDEYHVTSDTCSHGEASLCEGIVDGGEVECPWHSGRFDIRTGEASCYPAVAPIRVYRTQVVDGDVFFLKD